jgi:short-subunit dehydrogenase
MRIADIMNIVITGSSKGIGRGMAREFLRRGHNVMISSRHADAVDKTVVELGAEFPGVRVFGRPCDVTRIEDVQALWDASVVAFGTVDYWVNNAGRVNPRLPIDELPVAEIDATIDTNLRGLLYCCIVAFKGMKGQGSGWIFNMEGFGSDGMVNVRQVPYGITKVALRYATKALVKTAEGSAVKVGYLSPGMVTTEMIVPPPERRGPAFESTKKVLNILADHVETVTPFLVDGMLRAEKNGAAVRWLTRGKVMLRFLLAPVQKRRPIDEALAREAA